MALSKKKKEERKKEKKKKDNRMALGITRKPIKPKHHTLKVASRVLTCALITVAARVRTFHFHLDWIRTAFIIFCTNLTVKFQIDAVICGDATDALSI